jgi:hypothetical protein
VPVIVGGCATHTAALHLMRTGAAGVLAGFGGGSGHTTAAVLGVAVPMATVIADVAAARRDYLDESGGRYVHVIADGGMTRSGDIAKALACGADAVMVGSPFAKAAQAPGRGYHWGSEAHHPELPRGARVKVGTIGSLEQILHGPSTAADGSMNLMGALRRSMATAGYSDLKEFQRVEVVVTPARSGGDHGPSRRLRQDGPESIKHGFGRCRVPGEELKCHGSLMKQHLKTMHHGAACVFRLAKKSGLNGLEHCIQNDLTFAQDAGRYAEIPWLYRATNRGCVYYDIGLPDCFPIIEATPEADLQFSRYGPGSLGGPVVHRNRGIPGPQAKRYGTPGTAGPQHRCPLARNRCIFLNRPGSAYPVRIVSYQHSVDVLHDVDGANRLCGRVEHIDERNDLTLERARDAIAANSQCTHGINRPGQIRHLEGYVNEVQSQLAERRVVHHGSDRDVGI